MYGYHYCSTRLQRSTSTLQTAQERCWSYLHKQRTTISVSTRSRSAGIIRIDMNTISSPILKMQVEALIDLNSREDLSEEVGDIWGAERMRESWFGLVWPTSQGLCAYCPMF